MSTGDFMLGKSDYPLQDAIAKFASLGVEAAYLVPTSTGYDKSIMDVHVGVRDFLLRRGLHDFARQKQGPDHKVLIPIQIVTANGTVERQVSLYRPVTKSGDPRIWISGLKDFVKPWNLLALFTDTSGTLLAINCSDPALFGSPAPAIATQAETLWDEVGSAVEATSDRSPLTDILKQAVGASAESLVEKLFAIAQQGWVESLRPGDTGVGFTLETLLGIAANSSKDPDYEGVEIKAGRLSKSRAARQTLFAKTPDWANSALSAVQLLHQFGYLDENERPSLYVTVREIPNPQGLFLRVNDDQSLLETLARVPSSTTAMRVSQWPFDALRQSLLAKHTETVWVKADRRTVDGIEQFRFVSATHTRAPLVGNFAQLLNLGKVTLDYTMHLKESGLVRDHGYLFRMQRGDMPLLFPQAIEHDLLKRT